MTQYQLTAAAAAFFSLTCGAAWSADYEVQRTLQVPMTATEAWNAVGDFCDIDDWHPGIGACALRVIDGRLHRVLTHADGSETTERRIAVEPGLSYTYAVTGSALPVENFIATFAIEPLDGSLISWSARFRSDDPGAEAAITDMIETGMAAIEALLGTE